MAVNKEDRELLRLALDGTRAAVRHLLILERTSIRSVNLMPNELDRLPHAIGAMLARPSQDLGWLAEAIRLLGEIATARIEGASLNRRGVRAMELTSRGLGVPLSIT
jgi:hypothetical protein